MLKLDLLAIYLFFSYLLSMLAFLYGGIRALLFDLMFTILVYEVFIFVTTGLVILSMVKLFCSISFWCFTSGFFSSWQPQLCKIVFVRVLFLCELGVWVWCFLDCLLD